jgi:beta-glucosidase/6-phospho-beta-glucosidase/beta-galactosidase
MFYYLYKQDIERLAAIGIPYLCFSIPWTQGVPFGVAGSEVNPSPASQIRNTNSRQQSEKSGISHS